MAGRDGFRVLVTMWIPESRNWENRYVATFEPDRVVLHRGRPRRAVTAVYAVDVDIVLQTALWFEFRAIHDNETTLHGQFYWRPRRRERPAFAEALRASGFLVAPDPRWWPARWLNLPLRREHARRFTKSLVQQYGPPAAPQD